MNYIEIQNALKVCNPTDAKCCVGDDKVKSEIGCYPRGFFLETENRNSQGKAAIVIGINPGVLDESSFERKAMQSAGENRELAYLQWENFFKDHVLNDYIYYTGPRGMLNGLGYDGPILWTETYKCENESENGFKYSIAGVCTKKHLKEELLWFKDTYKDFIVVACGREVFNFLNNDTWLNHIPKLIGIYHPSNGYSQKYFAGMFKPREDYHFTKEAKSFFEDEGKSPIFLGEREIKDHHNPPSPLSSIRA